MTQTSSAPTRPFFEEISQLKHELTAEGEAVNVRLARAIEGLMEEDPDLLDDVAVSDADVNAMQISIDNLAFRLLALYQPVAVDLRVIVAAIKINSDLERVGDLAVNIAEAARRYFATGRRIELAFLPRMGRYRPHDADERAAVVRVGHPRVGAVGARTGRRARFPSRAGGARTPAR